MEKIGSWIWLDVPQTGSTNDEVAKLCAKLNTPCIVTAGQQTAGRGRRGHSWISLEGNLFMSFAFEATALQAGHLAVLSGVAVAQTVRCFCPEANIAVKWPNDVLVDGAKISGILFEKAPNGFWIMGIGINVVSSPTIDQAGYATAGLNALGASTDRLSVLRCFVANFDALNALYQQEGFESIRKLWLDIAWKRGKKITIKQENEEYEGILEDLNANGSLVLRTQNGVKKILAGEICLKED